ncbi:MAG TPA: hypothetical protein VHW09_06300 [Bryobacteraceae bacterium]|jgi:hypothetical protein|nr:hypothetical protein [Bryobacteraceae bacterium]
MEHIVTIALIAASALLGAGVGLDWVFRGLNKKRNDYRMGQALRRGLANPDGVRNSRIRIVQWQACESTSAR